ncbi:MAG: hypothetical protein Q4G43_05725 [Mobilicoccus sp.]|nr:hypothetical protein [Mobilicoccus sp.]
MASAALGGRTTAEARLLVGDQTIQAQAVPGYALATQQLAGSYARLAVGDAVTGAVPDGVEVKASNIPDSAVVRLEAEADDAETAVAAADQAADALVAAVRGVTGPDRSDDALETWQQARERLREAEAEASALAGQPEQARAQDVVAFREIEVEALAQAHRDAVRATASGSASLAVTQRADVISSTTSRSVALGAFAGASLALLALGAIVIARGRTSL